MGRSRSAFSNYTEAQKKDILRALGEPRDLQALRMAWSNGKRDPAPQAIALCRGLALGSLSLPRVRLKEAQDEVDRICDLADRLAREIHGASDPARFVLRARGGLIPHPEATNIGRLGPARTPADRQDEPYRLLVRLRDAASKKSLAPYFMGAPPLLAKPGRPRTLAAEEFTRNLFRFVWFPWTGNPSRGTYFCRFLEQAIRPTGLLAQNGDLKKVAERAFSLANASPEYRDWLKSAQEGARLARG